MRDNYTAILCGRLQKIENLQAKLANFKDGVVFGGELPHHIKEGLKTPEVRSKIDAKIAKAERIKLNIAIAIYNDI